ncbi:5-carboxymethyl-2-hydroxymuconate Delta-isomerase [Leucothrix arctica]|uniref:5-carboxymethyl-2-hydroxymuconate isomerase n=1 Tax=Leucothrix arctica TaxID=1481894 RepID=A0A317CEQ2_9GAMM|nr:5-carboxymethyl-2-hydroxymuconate isomerase [Leucothrix arctica]PWQ96829.1 5-carboxymethyl-2-hydroxymuconate isomerase [Leucothrix arctica]
MPHFVIDCSESLLSTHDAEAINLHVHKAANSTELFGESNIQVRLVPFSNSFMGGKKVESIHVFASILEGRTKEQKLALSKAVITALAEMFPDVETIGMDVCDLEKGVGFSKKKL